MTEKSDSVLLLESLIVILSQLLQHNKTVNFGQDGLNFAMTIMLNGKNFNLWSQMLKMKLLGKDKLGYIDRSIPKPLEIGEKYRK